MRRVKGCLKNLDKEELKDLFQELGLIYQTVCNRYSDGSRAEYSEELVRAWILGSCWTRRGTREEPPGRT